MLIIGRSFIPHGAILVSCVLYLEESSGNVRGMRNLELLRFVQQTENATENNRRLLNVLDFFFQMVFRFVYLSLLCILRFTKLFRIIYIFIIFDNDTNLVKMYRANLKTQQNHL